MNLPPKKRHRPLTKVALFLAGLFILLWIAARLPDLSFIFIVSGLLSFLMTPIVHTLESRLRLRRIPAVSVSFLFIAVIVVGLGWETGPILYEKLLSTYDHFRVFPFQAKLDELAASIVARIPLVDH